VSFIIDSLLSCKTYNYNAPYQRKEKIAFALDLRRNGNSTLYVFII